MARYPKGSELTEQQEIFCREFIKDLNATQAAIRAKYSEASASSQASRLLSHDKIQARIADLKKSQFKRLEVSSDAILKELGRIGFSDIRDIVDENGCIRPINQWPKAVARAVASIEVFEEFEFHHGRFTCEVCAKSASKEVIGQTKKLKFWSKDRGLELLGKHQKLFTDKIELSGKLTLEDLAAATGEESDGDQ